MEKLLFTRDFTTHASLRLPTIASHLTLSQTAPILHVLISPKMPKVRWQQTKKKSNFIVTAHKKTLNKAQPQLVKSYQTQVYKPVTWLTVSPKLCGGHD